jgi:hypothetical protein
VREFVIGGPGQVTSGRGPLIVFDHHNLTGRQHERTEALEYSLRLANEMQDVGEQRAAECAGPGGGPLG